MIERKLFQKMPLAALAWAFFLATSALAYPQPRDLGVDLGFKQFPLENTCEGADISPQIEILGCNASSLAIILEDQDAPSGSFIHWIIWNIPPASVIPSGIARNANIEQPFPARQGMNDFGEIEYAGPCPPSGKAHRYFFRVFGLDEMLNLEGGASLADLKKAMQGHVLQEGKAMAAFGR